MINSSNSSQPELRFSETQINAVNNGDDDEDPNELPVLTGNLFISHDKKWCYQIGVIDYLQTFNFQKKVEVWYKKYLKNRDPKKVSVSNSNFYGDRYINFMRHSVF